MAITYTPVASTRRETYDMETGEPQIAVQEFTVADWDVDPRLFDLVGAHFGGWADVYPKSTFVVLHRYYRVPGKTPGTWDVFDKADDYQDALEIIATSHMSVNPSPSPGQVGGSKSLLIADSGCPEMAGVLNRMEQDRQREHEDKVAKDEARQQAEAKRARNKASSDAFRRMREGTDSGRELANLWNAWTKEMQADPDRLEAFRQDPERMKIYAAAMDATTVPVKKKAIRLCLESCPETLAILNRRILKTPIIGTDAVVYSAWTPSADSLLALPFSTVRHLDGVWHGRVGTERLPPELAAMPCGQDRLVSVASWQSQRYDAAYAAILARYPEAATGRKNMGEISVE